jgi:hypothetical protein
LEARGRPIRASHAGLQTSGRRLSTPEGTAPILFRRGPTDDVDCGYDDGLTSSSFVGLIPNAGPKWQASSEVHTLVNDSGSVAERCTYRFSTLRMGHVPLCERAEDRLVPAECRTSPHRREAEDRASVRGENKISRTKYWLRNGLSPLVACD